MSTALVIGPDLAHLASGGSIGDAPHRVRSAIEGPAERAAGLRRLLAGDVDTVLIVDRAVPVRLDWAASGAPFALVADHLNLTGDNPLVGPNADDWGPRFPDLTDAWDPALRRALRRAAVEAGIELREGVLAGVAAAAPTASELSMLRMVGAEMASEGFVHEGIVARHAGRRAAGIAVLGKGGLPGDANRTEELVGRAIAALRPGADARAPS